MRRQDDLGKHHPKHLRGWKAPAAPVPPRLSPSLEAKPQTAGLLSGLSGKLRRIVRRRKNESARLGAGRSPKSPGVAAPDDRLL